MKPLCVELFAGLHGWGEGFVPEGFRVVGFDIVDMCSELGMPRPSGIDLVLQDVTTLHGRQFKDAAVIVASPPCQEYSRYAMPFGALWQEHARMDDDGAPAGNYLGKNPVFNYLFRACFRIQREASEAAGHHVPMIVENVKGAQRFLGPARCHFGSYYLYGDVPALMPITLKKRMKCKIDCSPRMFKDRVASTPEEAHAMHFRMPDGQKLPVGHGSEARKNQGGSWFGIGSPGQTEVGINPVNGVKQGKKRKAASAQIAKIPFPLANHIARCFKPEATCPG